MTSFFGKHETRQVKNGEQVLISLYSAPDDVGDENWFADTYTVSRELSKGDRSTALAAIQAIEKGDSPRLMTAEGSATHELWSRLSRFGYLSGQSAEIGEMPVRNWAVRPGLHTAWMLFLLASRVDFLSEKVLREVSSGYSRTRDDFIRIPEDALLKLRNAMQKSGTPLAPAQQCSGGLFAKLKKLGLIEIRGEICQTTDLGSVTTPFFLDHIIHEKRIWLDEVNR